MANGFYFMSFSNVRYYFVMAVCTYAMKFLFAEDYVKLIRAKRFRLKSVSALEFPLTAFL